MTKEEQDVAYARLRWAAVVVGSLILVAAVPVVVVYSLRDRIKRARERVRGAQAFFYRMQDPNEDYVCIACGKPTLPRHLYCSATCAKQDGSL